MRRISRKGFTLIELLVAIGILMMLSSLLVYLFQGGVDLWRTAQRKRQVHENASFVLNKLSSDLDSLWYPYYPVTSPQPNIPYLYSARTKAGNQWVEFTRLRSGFSSPGDSIDPKDQLERVVYLHEQETGKLFRGTFPPLKPTPHLSEPHLLNWDVPPSPSNNSDQSQSTTSDDRVQAYRERFFETYAEDILYLELQFFGPWSQNWIPVSKYGQKKGASLYWDSTRKRMKKFRLHETKINPGQFPVALPKMIRIILHARPYKPEEAPRLLQELPAADAGKRITVSNARHLDGKSYAKMNQEWFHFEITGSDQIKIVARAIRGTDRQHHDRGSKLLSGKTFERTISVPVYPSDAVYNK